MEKNQKREFAHAIQQLFEEIGRSDFFDDLADYCSGESEGACIGPDVVNEFIDMVYLMVKDLDSDDDEPGLFERIRDLVTQADPSLPPLPRHWDYAFLADSDGVGISYLGRSDIQVIASPGLDNSFDDCEIPVEVLYRLGEEPIHYHERWTIPSPTVEAWHELMESLAMRFSPSSVTVRTRLFPWESPVRGSCLRAHTSWGNFIVEGESDLISYNSLVSGDHHWVRFHPDDQFCVVVPKPDPFSGDEA